jgi:hypothetical protein
MGDAAHFHSPITRKIGPRNNSPDTALFGVAYELETPFFPHLAAPNLAPKTALYRTCTEHFMNSIRKAEFGLGKGF